MLQTLKNTLNPRFYAVISKIRKLDKIKINLGSGGTGLADWINIDARSGHKDICLALDIRKKLPFRDGQARCIIAEHVLEHIDFRWEVPNLLKELHRILEPGGTLRIVVPDVKRFLEAYVSQDNGKWRDLGWDAEKLPADIFTPMHVLNHVFHQEGEHLFGYDFETLEGILRRAGFSKIVKQQFRVSNDPELCIDQPVHEKYSLYAEAIK